ncbi:MAG TPA: ATP-binding protein, partial [Saprospiraceae bacterium]|nr:ATP-binding protein [Saprospiraceae bacterium]
DIIWSINTEGHHRESIADRIRNYSTDLLSQKNIACSYNIDQQVDRKLRQPESRKNILLIIKEALNNIAKYSEASQAEVIISIDGAHIVITITDNGKGFDPNVVSRGNGLSNMSQRTHLLGGNFHIRSSAGGGTCIQSRIPLSRIRKL